MAGFTEPITLLPGIQAKVVSAATAVGTAKSQVFNSDPRGDQILTLIAKRTAITALTVDLEVSPDGGTTWEKHTTAISLLTAAARVAVGANQLCRLNIATFTGTSVDIFATSGV